MITPWQSQKTEARTFPAEFWTRNFLGLEETGPYSQTSATLCRMRQNMSIAILECALKKDGDILWHETKGSRHQRETWKIINDLRGKKQAAENIQTQLSSDELNTFYCSIAEKLQKSINVTKDPLTYLSEIGVYETFFFIPTDIQEIKGIFAESKKKTSSGWDDISLKILEQLPDNALTILAETINISFSRGEFPSFLKMATVIPLHKGGDHDLPANFRPISLLPSSSKLIEKLVKKRVIVFLKKHNILNSHQFGFQSSKSTQDAIFSFLETLYLNLNDQEAAAAVFCDLSKAFDCVNHEILLRKLELYGFRGTALTWFSSYLADRRQTVLLNGMGSREGIVRCGVPQGSVLGPLLFLIYVNDLTEVDIKGKFTMFADDTTILCHNKNITELHNDISADIEKVKEWCDANLLSFNIRKTNIVSFKCTLNDVSLADEVIPNVSDIKFLGLHIDDKLAFEGHISQLCKKLASGCYAVRIVSNELCIANARQVYFSLIESHLRYGICFWGMCSKNRFNMVFLLQKRAMRYICKAKYRDSCRPLFLKQKILTLVCIFIMETVCLLHKKYKNILDCSPSYSTRRPNQISLLKPSSALTQKSLIYQSKKMYNHLPLRIREIRDLNKFKKEVYKLLVEKAYYTLEEFYLDSLS